MRHGTVACCAVLVALVWSTPGFATEHTSGESALSSEVPSVPAPPPIPKEQKESKEQKDVPKEPIKDVPRESPKETPKETPKESQKETREPKDAKEPKESKKSESSKHDESPAPKPPKDSAHSNKKDKAESKSDGKVAPKEAAKSEAEKAPADKPTGEKSSTDKPATPDSEPMAKPETPAKRPIGSVMLTVKLALLADPALVPYDIEVEMDGEKAVLSGKVATDEEKKRAAEIAQGIEPIKGVVNKLDVNKDLAAALVKRQDQAIVQYVKERFARSETLKAAGFEVKCEQGVVSLSGKTRFQVFALEAAQAARQVPGVRAVDTSNIQVSGE